MPVSYRIARLFSRNRARGWILLALLILVLAQVGPFAAAGLLVQAEETAMNRTGVINVGSANIRSGPATTFGVVDVAHEGQAVNVLAIEPAGGATSIYGPEWYKVSYMTSTGYAHEGYVVDDFVTLDPEPVVIVPDADFEAWLTSQGFPESYKPGLRALHTTYPNWTFKALQTNLDWNTVIEYENSPGRSLISNSRNDGWKSTEDCAYDWATNTWAPYDGSSWVMCSKATIAYYLDPRNMFNATRIFQFEALNYQPGVQIQTGVETILKNTFMSDTSFTYTDRSTNTEKTILYAEAFIRAAEYSGVNPYHLASRTRIEVGSSGSASVRGTFSADLKAAYDSQGIPYTEITTEFDGYYNFFNIGASNSTEILGNVRNGLEYAKYGSDRKAEQTATDDLQLIPWNDRYHAIVGGAYFIGSKYIQVGQNTIYLQKFDVDNSDGKLYWHQYQSNIEAPYNESSNMAKAYASLGMTADPMVFIIPVFLNMPESASPQAAAGNPNNWLQSVTIGGQNLTPTFDPAITGEYSLIVENDVASVEVSAVPVTSKATVSGTGTLQLLTGSNPVNLVVTAENGATRTYSINIIRKTASGDPTVTPTPVPSVTATISPSATLAPTPSPTPSPSPSPTPTAAPTSTPTAAPLVSSAVYQIGQSTITGLNPLDSQNAVTTFTSNLSVPNGYTIAVYQGGGSLCTSFVGTDCQVKVMNGETSVLEYRVILYGDANGDGKINAIDLTTICWHIQNKDIISGLYLTASDVNRDGKSNAIDLTIIVRYIQRTLTIQQN